MNSLQAALRQLRAELSVIDAAHRGQIHERTLRSWEAGVGLPHRAKLIQYVQAMNGDVGPFLAYRSELEIQRWRDGCATMPDAMCAVLMAVVRQPGISAALLMQQLGWTRANCYVAVEQLRRQHLISEARTGQPIIPTTRGTVLATYWRRTNAPQIDCYKMARCKARSNVDRRSQRTYLQSDSLMWRLAIAPSGEMAIQFAPPNTAIGTR